MSAPTPFHIEPALASRLATAKEAVWLRIGALQSSMNDRERALDAFERVLQVNPTNVHAMTQAGAVLAKKECYSEAVSYLQRAIAAESTCGEAWAVLAHCYVMTDELQKAYQAYQNALNHLPDPGDPNLWYGIGLLYDRYGSLDNALEAFLAVLNIAPNFERAVEVCFCIGIIYKEQQKLDDALKYFNKVVVAANPPPPLTRADGWYQIGHVNELKREVPKALEMYKQALAENPKHAKTLQNLGWLEHSHNSNSAEGIRLLRQSVEVDPADGQTWYLLGRVFMALREFRQAYDAYQQAVYRDGRNATFWCSIGVLYYQMNQYRDAMDAYTRAIRLNPYVSEVWYDLGTLYESCSQINDAIDAYRRAADLAPQNQQITKRLAVLQSQASQGNRNLSQQPQQPTPQPPPHPQLPPPQPHLQQPHARQQPVPPPHSDQMLMQQQHPQQQGPALQQLPVHSRALQPLTVRTQGGSALQQPMQLQQPLPPPQQPPQGQQQPPQGPPQQLQQPIQPLRRPLSQQQHPMQQQAQGAHTMHPHPQPQPHPSSQAPSTHSSQMPRSQPLGSQPLGAQPHPSTQLSQLSMPNRQQQHPQQQPGQPSQMDMVQRTDQDRQDRMQPGQLGHHMSQQHPASAHLSQPLPHHPQPVGQQGPVPPHELPQLPSLQSQQDKPGGQHQLQAFNSNNQPQPPLHPPHELKTSGGLERPGERPPILQPQQQAGAGSNQLPPPSEGAQTDSRPPSDSLMSRRLSLNSVDGSVKGRDEAPGHLERIPSLQRPDQAGNIGPKPPLGQASQPIPSVGLDTIATQAGAAPRMPAISSLPSLGPPPTADQQISQQQQASVPGQGARDGMAAAPVSNSIPTQTLPSTSSLSVPNSSSQLTGLKSTPLAPLQQQQQQQNYSQGENRYMEQQGQGPVLPPVSSAGTQGHISSVPPVSEVQGSGLHRPADSQRPQGSEGTVQANDSASQSRTGVVGQDASQQGEKGDSAPGVSGAPSSGSLPRPSSFVAHPSPTATSTGVQHLSPSGASVPSVHAGNEDAKLLHSVAVSSQSMGPSPPVQSKSPSTSNIQGGTMPMNASAGQGSSPPTPALAIPRSAPAPRIPSLKDADMRSSSLSGGLGASSLTKFGRAPGTPVGKSSMPSTLPSPLPAARQSAGNMLHGSSGMSTSPQRLANPPVPPLKSAPAPVVNPPNSVPEALPSPSSFPVLPALSGKSDGDRDSTPTSNAEKASGSRSPVDDASKNAITTNGQQQIENDARNSRDSLPLGREKVGRPLPGIPRSVPISSLSGTDGKGNLTGQAPQDANVSHSAQPLDDAGNSSKREMSPDTEAERIHKRPRVQESGNKRSEDSFGSRDDSQDPMRRGSGGRDQNGSAGAVDQIHNNAQSNHDSSPNDGNSIIHSQSDVGAIEISKSHPSSQNDGEGGAGRSGASLSGDLSRTRLPPRSLPALASNTPLPSFRRERMNMAAGKPNPYNSAAPRLKSPVLGIPGRSSAPLHLRSAPVSVVPVPLKSQPFPSNKNQRLSALGRPRDAGPGSSFGRVMSPRSSESADDKQRRGDQKGPSLSAIHEGGGRRDSLGDKDHNSPDAKVSEPTGTAS